MHDVVEYDDDVEWEDKETSVRSLQDIKKADERESTAAREEPHHDFVVRLTREVRSFIIYNHDKILDRIPLALRIGAD
jgi:hypothetical protein